jgi:hypothetical protein
VQAQRDDSHRQEADGDYSSGYQAHGSHSRGREPKSDYPDTDHAKRHGTDSYDSKGHDPNGQQSLSGIADGDHASRSSGGIAVLARAEGDMDEGKAPPYHGRPIFERHFAVLLLVC